MSARLSAAQRVIMLGMLRDGPFGPRGATWNSVATLRTRGLVVQLGNTQSFILTDAGGKALRDHYAARWAKDGCLAYMQRVDEIDGLLASKRLAA